MSLEEHENESENESNDKDDSKEESNNNMTSHNIIYGNILNIKYFENYKQEDFEGFQIITNSSYGRSIEFFIDTTRTCCEEFGIDITYPTNKTLDDMLGASINKITFAPENSKSDPWLVSLLISTNRGMIEITAYNTSGYYPHIIRFKWPGKEEEEQVLPNL